MAHGPGMEELHGHRGTHRKPTMAEAMDHSVMPTSMLARLHCLLIGSAANLR